MRGAAAGESLGRTKTIFANLSPKAIQNHLPVLLAGLYATQMLVGEEPGITHAELVADSERLAGLGFSGDREEAVRLLSIYITLHATVEEAEEVFAEASVRCTALLHEHWHEVDLVAAALMERSSLDAADVEALLGEGAGKFERLDRAEDDAIRAELYELSGDRHDVIGP